MGTMMPAPNCKHIVLSSDNEKNIAHKVCTMEHLFDFTEKLFSFLLGL